MDIKKHLEKNKTNIYLMKKNYQIQKEKNFIDNKSTRESKENPTSSTPNYKRKPNHISQLSNLINDNDKLDTIESKKSFSGHKRHISDMVEKKNLQHSKDNSLHRSTPKITKRLSQVNPQIMLMKPSEVINNSNPRSSKENLLYNLKECESNIKNINLNQNHFSNSQKDSTLKRKEENQLRSMKKMNAKSSNSNSTGKLTNVYYYNPISRPNEPGFISVRNTKCGIIKSNHNFVPELRMDITI